MKDINVFACSHKSYLKIDIFFNVFGFNIQVYPTLRFGLFVLFPLYHEMKIRFILKKADCSILLNFKYRRKNIYSDM